MSVVAHPTTENKEQETYVLDGRQRRCADDGDKIVTRGSRRRSVHHSTAVQRWWRSHGTLGTRIRALALLLWLARVRLWVFLTGGIAGKRWSNHLEKNTTLESQGKEAVQTKKAITYELNSVRRTSGLKKSEEARTLFDEGGHRTFHRRGVVTCAG